jgi:hypothetical protein
LGAVNGGSANLGKGNGGGEGGGDGSVKLRSFGEVDPVKRGWPMGGRTEYHGQVFFWDMRVGSGRALSTCLNEMLHTKGRRMNTSHKWC